MLYTRKYLLSFRCSTAHFSDLILVECYCCNKVYPHYLTNYAFDSALFFVTHFWNFFFLKFHIHGRGHLRAASDISRS